MYIIESKYKNLRDSLPNEPLIYKLIGYHVTSIDYYPSIKRYGLIPGKNKPAGQSWQGTYSGKAIYYHLSFPFHELDNSYDEDTLEPFSIIFEFLIHNYSRYFVPDEDVSLDVNYTPIAIKNKESIAVGYMNPPSNLRKIHIVDTPPARLWAKENKVQNIQFHRIK